MKYNFDTHQLEIENHEILKILSDRLNSHHLNIDENGYHKSYRLQSDNITMKIVSTDNKASDRDFKVFQAIETLKKEFNIKEIEKPYSKGLIPFQLM